MKKTQVDFMLTVSQLFQKLENGEDCKKECEQVAKMNDEQKESVSDQLLDRLQARDSKEVEKLVTAAKQVEYLDPNYIDDFAAVIREPFAPSTLQERQEIVKRVLSRTGYSKVLMEDIFWQSLTLIAINMQNNDLLAQYIRKMEQLRDGLNNEEE